MGSNRKPLGGRDGEGEGALGEGKMLLRERLMRAGGGW